jgi:hypothetical protein
LSPGAADARLGVHVDGGAGDDTVAATVGTLTAAEVGIHINGHFGNDTLSINGVPLVVPAVSSSEDAESDDEDDDESSLWVKFMGGPGDDTLTASIDAAIAAEIYLDLKGHWGDDTLSAEVTGSAAPENPAVSSLESEEEDDEDDDESDHDPSIHVRLDGGHGDDGLSASVGAAAGSYVKLRLDGGSGDDEIALTTLAEETVSPASAGGESSHHEDEPSLDAELNGNSGDDTLTATLGAIAAPYVKLDLDGGSGDDLLTLLANGANIAAGASLYAKLDGGSGDDEVNGTFDGQILGLLAYYAQGGPGDDTLVSNLTAAPGSTGMLCAASAGGAGTDQVTLNVFDNSGDGGPSLLAALHAAIFDPGAHDTLVHTDNVVVVLNNGHHHGQNDDDDD